MKECYSYISDLFLTFLGGISYANSPDELDSKIEAIQ